jgi:hypothetical protein
VRKALLASLHLARYSARGAVRAVVAMHRRRAELESMPGLGAAHLFFTFDSSALTGGRPTPRRWALLCGWNEDEALDEALVASPVLEGFLDEALESWYVRLEPVRVVDGSWRGWRPSTEGVRPLADDEPVIVMTYGRLKRRHIPAFLRANRRALAQAMRHPGMLSWLGLSDAVPVASTFSVWRSIADVQRYAYGPGDHQPVARHSKAVPWADDYFFARFRPLTSTGTWDGHDPVADALSGNRALATAAYTS